MAKKCKDDKNRWRNKTVGFRVSPEEWEQFGTIVKLSGLTKQDYLINRIYQRDVVIQGNPRVYKALRNELGKVLEELKLLNERKNTELIDDELLDTINFITTVMSGLNNEQNKSSYPAR